MSKRRQRGFVLITALVLAVLYFMLMELVLIDSSRALAEAQKFRARTVAQALAENGAELAAQEIIARGGAKVEASDFLGTMSGKMTHTGNTFELEGEGTSTGILRQQSTVTVQGRIDPDGTIKIDYTIHSQ